MEARNELEALSRTAATFPPRTARGRVLPSLLFFTDPARVPDPESVARRLPQGAGIVFRAFGAANAIAQGLKLREIADARGLILLAGADADLARAIAADGIHLPERLASEASAFRTDHPDWLITAAAHGVEAVRAADSEIDALVVSPVFASNSPSAGAPLGVSGLRERIAVTDKPIYALGGIRADTVKQLEGLKIVGLAAIEALAG